MDNVKYIATQSCAIIAKHKFNITKHTHTLCVCVCVCVFKPKHQRLSIQYFNLVSKGAYKDQRPLGFEKLHSLHREIRTHNIMLKC